MNSYHLTEFAALSLEEIIRYIAINSPVHANKVRHEILKCCQLVADRPNLGKCRTDLAPIPIRMKSVTRYPNYLVFYVPETQPLQILDILHGKRNLPRILGRT